jgi:hypothetical protein
MTGDKQRPGGAESDPEALAPIRAFTAAMNERDLDALRSALHYPHFRLADGVMRITEKAFDLGPPWEAYADVARGSLDAWEVIHSSDDKVHFAIRVTRSETAVSPPSSSSRCG